MNRRLPLYCAILLASASQGILAVETAPRITDREIIETLTRLDAGQKALAEQVDQRFAAVEKRLDDQFAMMLTMFSAMILLIVSLFGYIVWDRRTALRPLESRLMQLEHDLERDLEIRHQQGSLPTRLLNALRRLAGEDEKLAAVLRGFSLL